MLAAHHLKKLGRPIEGLTDARDAVRGTTALVDGVRLVYCLWPAEEARAKRVCKDLGLRYAPNLIVLGGVAKANGPVTRRVSTYVRGANGLLVDRTTDLGTNSVSQDEQEASFVDAIAAAARHGQPFMKTGAGGVYAQRDRLPSELSGLARHKLEGMAAEALKRGEIVLCIAKGSATPKWLDAPGGQFAIGLGEFRLGSEPPS